MMTTKGWRRAWPMGLALMALVCAPGCGANNEPEELAESQSLLLTDPTGTITVAIKQCGPAGFPPNTIGSVSCGVTPGYVLVGGGGRVVGETVPGALLQASMPFGQAWIIQAKDHVHPGGYQLQAESIGLKLQGVSQSALAGMVTVSQYNSGTASHAPVIQVFVSNKSLVTLGAGAAVHNLSGQQLLVESDALVDDSNGDSVIGWVTSSKDHEISFLDTVDMYLITMPACPPGFPYGCVATTGGGFISSIGTGYRSATTTVSGPIVGLAAAAHYHGAGRLLTAIDVASSGNQSTVTVDSKDHDIFDSGYTTGGYVSLYVPL